MKKQILFAALAVASVMNAQVAIDYRNFFAASAVNANGTTLERENYASTSDAIKANQWNGSGKPSYHVGDDFAIATSDLAYTDAIGNQYIDNNAGLQVIAPFTDEFDGNGHDAIYSLSSKQTDYTGKAFYASFLLKVDSCKSTNGLDIFAIDGNHCATTQRGRVFVKRGPKVNDIAQKTFQVGVTFNSNYGSTSSTTFAWGSTVLVVVKYTPAATGDETVALYVNPLLASAEAGNTPVHSETGSSSQIKGIKGLTLRKRNNVAYKLAGLRFTDSWATAVAAVSNDPEQEETAVDSVATHFNDGTWGTVLAKVDGSYPVTSGSYPTDTIKGFILNSAVIADGSIKRTGESTNAYTNRVMIDKNGSFVTPLLSNVSTVDLAFNTGSDSKTLTLQYLNEDSQWVNVETITGMKALAEVTYTLNVNAETKIRVLNGNGGNLYVWAITTHPYVESPATAVENVATDKAIKLIENGQIIILKNGKRYNVLGAEL